MKKFSRNVISSAVVAMTLAATMLSTQGHAAGEAKKLPDEIANFIYRYEGALFNNNRHYYGKSGPYRFVEYADIEKAFQKNSIKAAEDFSKDFIVTRVEVGSTQELDDGEGGLVAEAAGKFVFMPVKFIFTHARDLVTFEGEHNQNFLICAGSVYSKFGGVFRGCSSFLGHVFRELYPAALEAYNKKLTPDFLKVLKGGKPLYMEGTVHYLAYEAVEADPALKKECSTGMGPKCLNGIDKALGFEVKK